MSLWRFTVTRIAILLATGPEPTEAEIRVIVSWLGSTGQEVLR